MEGDIDKKLKDVLKKNKKSDIKVKIGIYAGKRGPYKLYKIKGGSIIAIKSKKGVKGGATEDEFNEIIADDKVYKLSDLDEHEFDELPQTDIDKMGKEVKIVKTVELKPEKKRVQSAKQKEWLEFVAKVAMLPEMAGKSRSYVMKEASRLRKNKN